jgi:hypothetical protein
MKIKLPEVIIFTIQRSGSHLLLDLLESHPDINGRRELFYNRTERRQLELPYVEGKVNVAILHYGQLDNFYYFGGELKKVKIIHLLRNPRNVAISILQLVADRKLNKNIKGHQEVRKYYGERAEIDVSQLPDRISKTIEKQNAEIEMLKDMEHLQIRYEDFVPDEKSIEYLDDDIAKRILDFIGLEYRDRLRTKLVKTRVYEDKIVPKNVVSKHVVLKNIPYGKPVKKSERKQIKYKKK